MSVMECRREGCRNILCNRRSARYGYICGDCFAELVKLGVATNIDAFLEVSPKYTNEDAARAYFDKIFPMSDGSCEP